MPNEQEFEKEILFFKKLYERRVKYLLIGRQACALYGLPLYTFDYDIAVDNSTENLEKLLEIAKQLELYPRRDREKILSKQIPIFSLQNDMKIDVFCAKKYGTIDKKTIVFSEAFARREIKRDRKYGLVFYVPEISDLIMFKKINPREKDFEDIKMLEVIKA
ncbi:MAG: hypothetical protein QME68_00215 [Elusimicrobiota bacterium]|nr:hypothetical protein [Elusimicrobiota bacterium]